MFHSLGDRVTHKLASLIGGGLITVVLTWMAYGPAIKGPFFFDDEHFILRNTAIHSLDRIPELYRTTVTQSAHIAGNFYRPNQQLAYALLYRFFGADNAAPYHLTAIALHLGNTFLLVAWLSLLGFSLGIAWISGLFFLLHPAQTEAVAYISGLSDPLTLFFILMALIVLTQSLNGTTADNKASSAIKTLGFTAFFFVLALTSKENSVVFLPAAIFSGIHFWWTKKKPLPKFFWSALGVYTLMTATYLALKFTVLNFTKSIGLSDDINAYTTDLSLRITTFIHVIWDYAALIFAPTDLYYEKPYTAYAGLTHWRAWFGLSMLMTSAVVILRGKRWPQAALGISLFWAGLFPYTGIIPVNAMWLEHWLYVPFVGLSVLLALLLTHIQRNILKSRVQWGVALTLCTALLAAMIGRTQARSAEWADPERFYLNEIAHGSVAIRTYNNLGLYYSDHGAPDKAAKYWRLATEGSKSRLFPQPYHNLARYDLERGNITSGLNHLHKALQVDHSFVYSLAVLADVLAAQGDTQKTLTVRAALEKTLRGETYDFDRLEQEIFDGGAAVH